MNDATPTYVPAVLDANRKLVVAIDGPAASGKSSTAQWVAEKLGFRHVDSGALYRAITAARLRAGGQPEEWSEPSVLAVARQVSLRPTERGFLPLIRGETAEGEIRGGEVTREVSRVARMQSVREWVNAEVRRVAEGHDVVVDGRDIGTVVFPEAQLKIFLVADPWERAKRRLVQRLSRRPTDAEIAEETERLVQRDARDATQTVQARDAVLIDTTYLTQSEQVDRIVALARGVTSRRGATSPVDGEAGSR
ncbi:MAG: (d)CMP kinase [Gemmatimonadaceae bacterium]|nr:(d)CMP kinase [Gemmatimonadaceae bacterium]NUQ94140.1 (d)CMP kinase [Gemmatimonadaceae bacterium]NUR19394.1 (d)CMP kinase [Gemmatimonadaceae bacterium]NUS98907.1 (d)CMP kinase [Gemmatimonadaceae bacterium]